ncbi:hypothetical protein ACHQM5_022287 [Ranunculus cassubicifolius]
MRYMSDVTFCYRFCPTDEEIVDFYLQEKLKGEPLSHPDPILSGDEEPSQIFDSLSIKERCAGKGNWKMQSGKQKEFTSII